MRRLIWNFIHWLAESCRLIRHPGSWLPNTKISLNVVMLHGVLRHIAAGFLPFLIFPLAIESYWISVAINFCLLGGASHFLILNALLIASTVRKRIAIDPTFYEAYGVCGISVIAVALAYKIADPSMVIPGNPVAKAFTELWFGIWVISFSFAFKEGFNTSLDKMNLPKRATYLRKLSPLTEQARIRASSRSKTSKKP